MKSFLRKHFKVLFWARSLSLEKDSCRSTLSIYLDYKVKKWLYGIVRSQYREYRLYVKSKTEVSGICVRLKEENKVKKEWADDRFRTKKFLSEYMQYKYEKSYELIKKREKAYTQFFGFGKGCKVQYGVEFSREHHLPGTLSVGNNVLFAKNVFVDYSGFLTIEDNVKIANGVIIETHSHTVNGFIPEDVHNCNVQTTLRICDGVSIGAKAVVLESCHYIGRGARIAAGAIVRADIPPYAIVSGNPAKIVGFIISPSNIEEYEEELYAPSERTDVNEFEKVFDKYYRSRLSTIKDFLSL